MVNIISVVSINEETVQTYPGFDPWWQAVHDNSPSKYKNDQIEYRRRRDNFAASLSAKYRIPIQRLKNIGFLFASLTQLKQEITDYEVRTLLCDDNTKIIVQNRACKGQLTVVAIAHSINSFKVFTTSAPLGKPILNPNREEE